MNKTNIDWPGLTHTWNPITGCRRECYYCYARRIHERFDPNVPFSHIEFHDERLLDKMPRTPSKIFIGSMSDIEYWQPAWTEQIIDVCRQNPRHTFMFLSKSPGSYSGFNWPVNTMQGLTITTNAGLSFYNSDKVVEIQKYTRPFLSIEPLLGMINFQLSFKSMELIIVGAMTGPGAIPPKPDWIQSIKRNVPAEKIYWKKNIKRYL